jgi:hypothetical protein
MDKKRKLAQGLKLQEAKKQGMAEFVLMEKLDELEDIIKDIKPTDLSPMEQKIESVKEKIKEPEKVDLSKLEKKIENIEEKLNEEIELELEII